MIHVLSLGIYTKIKKYYKKTNWKTVINRDIIQIDLSKRKI